MPSPRLLLPLLVALGAALPAVSAAQDDAGGEILLEVAYGWKLRGSTVTGAVTNGDRAAVSGTAKVTRTSSKGTPVTLATGGRIMVAAGDKQTVKLTLTTSGRSFFKRRTKATLNLVLQERAGARSGDVTEEIVVRKAR